MSIQKFKIREIDNDHFGLIIEYTNELTGSQSSRFNVPFE